ncbi:hypothetical protein HZB02_04615 [Candidatus Woesearchaeota archaeon]|nr:hypothetical protein [Candidatus Woesearchaeota archaeon]
MSFGAIRTPNISKNKNLSVSHLLTLPYFLGEGEKEKLPASTVLAKLIQSSVAHDPYYELIVHEVTSGRDLIRVGPRRLSVGDSCYHYCDNYAFFSDRHVVGGAERTVYDNVTELSFYLKDPSENKPVSTSLVDIILKRAAN